MAKNEIERAEDNSELDKAQGKTPSQQEIREYQEGDFQTTDPVTGTARKLPDAPEPVAPEVTEAPAKTTAKKPAK